MFGLFTPYRIMSNLRAFPGFPSSVTPVRTRVCQNKHRSNCCRSTIKILVSGQHILKIVDNLWAVDSAPNPAWGSSQRSPTGGQGASCPMPKKSTPLSVFGLDFRPSGLIRQSFPQQSSFPIQCLGVWMKHFLWTSSLQT